MCMRQRWEDKVIASRVADFEPPTLPPVADMRMMHQYPPLLRQQAQYSQPTSRYTFPYLNANGTMPRPAETTEEILPFSSGRRGGGPYIPQVDGPPEYSHHSMKCTSHPRPSEPQASPSEAINSDLDDSDTDDEDPEDGAGGNFNTAFCNYDKVCPKSVIPRE